MPHPPPFPKQIEELTPDFLGAALGVDVEELSSTRVGADRGMLGEIFLLNYSTTTRSHEIVAKFAALREESLASALRGRTHERELRCYEQLLAETPVTAPAHYGAWYDDETAHFLLLQDHVAADETVDQIAGITLDQAKLVMREMAALHAHWWERSELSELDWLPRLDSQIRITNLTTLARIGWEPLTALLGDQMPSVPAGFSDSLAERIEHALQTAAALPPTLLHCDLRADNLLFDAESNQVTLIDWQGCGTGPAAFDVAYFLAQSLTIEDRRRHQEHLISLWVDELRSHGVATTTEEAVAGYDESLWYGMAIACALPIVGDPTEERVRRLAAAVTTRTLAALSDAGEIN